MHIHLSRALAAALMLGASVGALAQPAGTFEAAVAYPVGLYPHQLVVSDFTGDGVADVAATVAAGWVGVLPGRGDGTFMPPRHSRAGYYPQTLAAGDFDGDGRTDLVVGQFSDQMTLLRGLGDGTFDPPIVYDGLSAVSFAVADLNGDGRDDVVVAPGSAAGVVLFVGAADGTLTPRGLLGTEVRGSGIAAADFDGDGVTDLAVAGSYRDTRILLGFGDGTFQPAPLAPPLGGQSLAVGDFDGDGRADLAGGGAVTVMLGNGDGTFQAAARQATEVQAASVAAADLDGDGRDDLALVAYIFSSKSGMLERSDAAVLLSDGTGGFRPLVHYGAGDFPRDVVVADFDGDAAIDMALVNALSFDVSVLLNGPVTKTRTMHVGNLSAHAQRAVDGVQWQVQVRVRAEDAAHAPMAGTLVSGTWDDGRAASCLTTTKGTCVVTRSGIDGRVGSVAFTVTALDNPTFPEYGHAPADNHDVDGDSDGTTMVVSGPPPGL